MKPNKAELIAKVEHLRAKVIAYDKNHEAKMQPLREMLDSLEAVIYSGADIKTLKDLK